MTAEGDVPRRTITRPSISSATKGAVGDASGYLLDERVHEWLVQSAADRGCSIAEVVRCALDREMIANPATSSESVNDGVVEYMAERYRLRDVAAALISERERKVKRERQR